jgi:ferredoxin
MAAAKPAGYKECGCGMGPALNMGSSTNAYVLADRGTWLSFKNRGDLAVLVEGDKRLFNQYGVMVVNPAKHPHVKQRWPRPLPTGWCRRQARQHRGLQDRRRTAVLPERQSLTSVSGRQRRSCAARDVPFLGQPGLYLSCRVPAWNIRPLRQAWARVPPRFSLSWAMHMIAYAWHGLVHVATVAPRTWPRTDPTQAETQRHAEEPPHQPGQVHRVPAVRDGLFVRELRRLRAGQVAHQGVRLPRDRAQGALHLHAVRRGLVPARLPGGGHHGRQGHRRQGGQRDHLRGCKVCTISCPFGTINYVQETGKVQKCDLCGGDPACATACPTGAITYIDANWTGLDKMQAWADKLGNQAAA